jgi:cytochrome c-type protein NapB
MLVSAVVWAGIAYAAEPIDDSQLGLEKSSVFDTPTPQAPNYQGSAPFKDDDYARSYPGAPPMIPHSLDDMLPITLARNNCLMCHQQPDRIGQKSPGAPTPLPASHYTSAKKLQGSRYNCVTCHAPQADAKPLVRNTYGN